MLDLLDYEFMRRALIAAFLTGLAAPAVGTYLVQRRLALLGDGIGHIALAGVAIGLLTGIAPPCSPPWSSPPPGPWSSSCCAHTAAPAATWRWRCCSTAASPAEC